MPLPEDWFTDHDGQRRVLDTEKVRLGIEKLQTALNDAAYALFEIKRLQPEAIKDHAAAAHAKACEVLNDLPRQPYGRSPGNAALDELRALNALPQNERRSGAVAFMKRLLGLRAD